MRSGVTSPQLLGLLPLDEVPHRPDAALQMTRNPFLSTLLAFLFSSLGSFAAEAIEGIWQKSDGEAQILLKIEKGILNGYLTKVAADAPVHDSKNPDPSLRGRKIVGLQIIRGFRKEGGKWVGGSLYDCRRGKSYKGSIWLEDRENLRMRGHLGVSLIGSTAKWKRIK